MTASLKARAESGERLMGVLLRMPGEELVEMAAVAGFDFVLVDCEHGPADVVALRQHVALAGVHRVPVVVRVGESDPGMILRALDQGAEGILAPHIDSAPDARALVSAAHYPPIGIRGFATYSRAGRFGQTDAGRGSSPNRYFAISEWEARAQERSADDSKLSIHFRLYASLSGAKQGW